MLLQRGFDADVHGSKGKAVLVALIRDGNVLVVRERGPKVLRRRKYQGLLAVSASIDASQATSSCTTRHRAVLGTWGNRPRRRGAGGGCLGWSV